MFIHIFTYNTSHFFTKNYITSIINIYYTGKIALSNKIHRILLHICKKYTHFVSSPVIISRQPVKM